MRLETKWGCIFLQRISYASLLTPDWGDTAVCSSIVACATGPFVTPFTFALDTSNLTSSRPGIEDNWVYKTSSNKQGVYHKSMCTKKNAVCYLTYIPQVGFALVKS